MSGRHVSFVVIYLVACLLLLEGALQLHYRMEAGDWLFRRSVLPIYAVDESAGFGLRPNLDLVHRTSEFRVPIATDSHGRRVERSGVEVPWTAPGGTRRVMVLGPSFAFGWGVRCGEAFPARLGEALADGLGPLDVVNAGVPALGPVAQLGWFRREGAGYRPDLVVQLVYGSLEVSEAYSEGYRVDGSGRLVPREAGGERRLRAALKRSAVVFRGWQVATALAARRGRTGGVQGAGRELPPVREFDPAAPETRHALDFYGDLKATVEAAGARLLVVTFPLSYVVYPEDFARWRHLGVSDPDSRRRFETAFAAELNARGIRTLDLTEDLIAAARGTPERLYYRIDIHWTAAGHAVAARRAAAVIREDPGAFGLGPRYKS